MRKFFLVFSIITLFSFSSPLKKRISDAVYRYEFYTTDNVVSPKEDRQYYWFKGGTIHNSEFGVGGELLDGTYNKFYHSNQLAENGDFKNGLKNGYWKNWYASGTLASKVYWDNGQMDGSFTLYDKLGGLIESGRYKNNKKHSVWIDYVKKDTTVYKNGTIVIIKVKDTASGSARPGFIKRLFKSKHKAAPQNVNSKPKEEQKQTFFKKLFGKKSGKAPKQEKKDKEGIKKEGFLKRLFSKKGTANK